MAAAEREIAPFALLVLNHHHAERDDPALVAEAFRGSGQRRNVRHEAIDYSFRLVQSNHWRHPGTFHPGLEGEMKLFRGSVFSGAFWEMKARYPVGGCRANYICNWRF